MAGGYPAGGSFFLAEQLDLYGGAIVADFAHRYPQVDLLDLFREVDPLHPEWVLNLLIHMPPEGSAYLAELQGGQQFRGWDASRIALAATVDAIRDLQYAYILSHTDPKKSAKPKPPVRFPTPYDEGRKPKRGNLFAATAGRMLNQARRRKGG